MTPTKIFTNNSHIFRTPEINVITYWKFFVRFLRSMARFCSNDPSKTTTIHWTNEQRASPSHKRETKFKFAGRNQISGVAPVSQDGTLSLSREWKSAQFPPWRHGSCRTEHLIEAYNAFREWNSVNFHSWGEKIRFGPRVNVLPREYSYFLSHNAVRNS